MASIEHRAVHDKRIKIINIKDYNEKWFYDEHSGEYFLTIEDMAKFYGKEKWELPKYVYGCCLTPFTLSLDEILENEAYDHHEYILDCLDGVGELRKAVEDFNDINKSNGSYNQDVMTIVELKQEEE